MGNHLLDDGERRVKAGFTPGPWRIHKDAKGRGYEIHGTQNHTADGTPTGREVCRINATRGGAHRGEGVRYWSHPHDDANARLIAAAPELFDALRRFTDRLSGSGWRGQASNSEVYACEFCHAEHEDCDLIQHADYCPITEARRALAMAEGTDHA